jgi:hypothetical protein
MRVLLDTVALFAIGLLMAAITMLAVRWPFANMASGELRCDDGGAVVVRVAGKDYAVNGMASSRGMSRRLLNLAGRALPVDDVTRLAGPPQVSV